MGQEAWRTVSRVASRPATLSHNPTVERTDTALSCDPAAHLGTLGEDTGRLPGTKENAMDSNDRKKILRQLGIEDDGSYRIDPDSGKLQKRNMYDKWDDTGTKIDSESGKIQERTMYDTYDDTRRRIDSDGTIQDRGIYPNYVKTGTRIDPDGTIRKRNMYDVYEDTGFRVEKETGKIQKRNTYGHYEDKIDE